MKKPSRLIFFLFLIIFVILFACSEEEEGLLIEPPDPPQVTDVSAPDKMALGVADFKTFQVIISGESEGVEVNCSIYYEENEIAAFQLLDDAGYTNFTVIPDYLFYNSGDVVAGDGIFTRWVNSLFTDSSSQFEVIFTVLNSDSLAIFQQSDELQVYMNSSPEMSAPNLPAVLDSVSLPLSLEALVTDPDGREDIDSVYFRLFEGTIPQNLLYKMEDPEMDSIFTYYMDSTFAAGLMGEYTFVFKAVDILGAESDSLGLTAVIENYPPTLSNPATIPDSSITIPVDTSEIIELKITVEVGDPQGLGDIATVWIDIERPTGVWIYDYPMADNGLPFDIDSLYLDYLGDETAGDGTYTTTRLYTYEADPGVHIFHFRAQDLVGNQAIAVSDSLELVQEQ